ncbi:hypothetical protein [Olleya namhaensis]|uniref:hypothetical protein n=1 Tax=Olleya namhaensis TaxID=1144750 RepID=UPI00232B8E52|nr:hypothetical protein [Olleya namhaensis]
MWNKFFKNTKEPNVNDSIQSVADYPKNSSLDINDFKKQLADSFNNDSARFYKPNLNLSDPFKVNYESLIELFKKLENENLDKFDDYFINYYHYNKYGYAENELIGILIKDFHIELFQSIEHHIYYFKKSYSSFSFYKNNFYKKRDKKSDESIIYFMAFKSLEVYQDTITYSHQDLCTNVVDFIHQEMFTYLDTKTRHKRNLAINSFNQTKRILEIEKGEPYKDYFPLYDKAKEGLNKVNSLEEYVFPLLTTEINLLASKLWVIQRRKKNKKTSQEVFKKGLRDFFGGDVDKGNMELLYRGNISFMYLLYKLEKINKCNSDLLFKSIKSEKRKKNLNIRLFNVAKKKFKTGDLPKNATLIDEIIKQIWK